MHPTPRPIRRLLVANRGEIARRVFRTARELGISTVAVYSDPDAGSPHVREADRSFRLPGQTSSQTYLDGSLILHAATATGADAIHPGYGFLSENPDFARLVGEAGLVWVGPTPESIRAMALKVEAKRIAAQAGVPLVPGAELAVGLSEDEAVAVCMSVGLPLLVKASAGGGGRGMRLVTDADEIPTALASARREARSSFGDDTVFVERYLSDARHVEVQVFGDSQGSIVHLHERECSVQRRHQKVIEESPSPGVSDALRSRLHSAAVQLAEAIDYVGAGTVEFMVYRDAGGEQFAFLEMNTRLQVEHPVTEAVTGIDLVRWQLLVAQGHALPASQEQIRVNGHAIEARLYAEDPAHDYRPSTGTIHRFSVPGSVRTDAGVETGSVVTPFYDSMLAKVIAHEADRQMATAVLRDGLARSVIHGPVTNRDSLLTILDSEAFLAGRTTTGMLDGDPLLRQSVIHEADEVRHAVAAAYAALGVADAASWGWRNVRATAEFVSIQRRGGRGVHTVFVEPSRAGNLVRLARTHDAPGVGVFSLEPEVSAGRLRAGNLGGGVVLVELDGVGARCSTSQYADEIFVDDGLASTAWLVEPRFADHSLAAEGAGPATSVPGTVTAVEVAVGDVVTQGQTLVVLEAMKVEHRVSADHDGVIERVLVEVGQSVDAHTVVVEFSAADRAEEEE